MLKYTVHRILVAIPTVLGLAVFIFVVMRVIPGDLAYLILGGDIGVVDPADVQELRDKLGINEPLFVKFDGRFPYAHPSEGSQFGAWMWSILNLDFGRSLYTNQPVLGEIKNKLSLSVEIAVLATLISFILAIPFGIAAALKQDRWVDYTIRVITIASMAAPSFWVAILIMIGLLTIFNWMQPLSYVSPFDKPLQHFQIIIFPALAGALYQISIGVRMMRSSMLEVLRQDYVTTARSKGLRERRVIFVHALKNAILPVITILALDFATILGGLIVIETVFGTPGLGRFLVLAVTRRDYPVVQTAVLIIAGMVMTVNLLTDLSYAWLDPRIRYQ